MKREQETSSAETKGGDGSARSSKGAAPMSPRRSILNLQRSAGNRAVARLMAGPTVQRTPLVVQRNLEEELNKKFDDNPPYEELAGHLHESLHAGTAPTGTGNTKTGPTTGSTPAPKGAAGAKKAYDDYIASLNDPEKKKEQEYKDKLEAAKSDEKKKKDKDTNLELLRKHGHNLTGKESDDDISELAEDFKAKDTEAKPKRKDQLAAKMGEQKLQGASQKAGGLEGMLSLPGGKKRKL
ncbi:MAG TPA: hypothetical protein VKI19_05335 [Acidimicrobiales bacterium]|nr:hypothetical protein [Acidimicrobiales bacterium]